MADDTVTLHPHQHGKLGNTHVEVLSDHVAVVAGELHPMDDGEQYTFTRAGIQVTRQGDEYTFSKAA